MSHEPPRGLDTLLNRIERVAATRGFSVRIGATDTTGRVWRTGTGKRGIPRGWETVGRTAGTNVIALRDGAKRGRNAQTLSARDRTRIQYTWERALGAIMKGSSPDTLMKAAGHIGNAIVMAIRAYLKAGAGATGAFRQVQPSREKRKVRESRGVVNPPMMHTGQLARSLVATIREI